MTTDGKLFFEGTLGIAVVCLGLGVLMFRKEIAPRKWQKKTGVIRSIESKVTNTGQYGTIEPVVEYEFEFEGKLIKTSHWRIGNFTVGNAESTADVLTRYKPGASVTVHINPRNPIQSVLEYGTTPLSWIPIGFGIAFALLSLLPISLE
jgi:hypothetical protein